MTPREASAPRAAGPAPIQGWVVLAGLILLIIGACSLIPGITTTGSPLRPGGPPIGRLFGLFAVSSGHTLFYLLTGAAALYCARTSRLAHKFLLVAGGAYLVLGCYGALGLQGISAEVVPMNPAGVWFACALGLTLVIAGIAVRGRGPRTPRE